MVTLQIIIYNYKMSWLVTYPYGEVIFDREEFVEVSLLWAEDYVNSEHLRELIQQSVRDFTDAWKWFNEAIEEFCPPTNTSELNEKYIAPDAGIELFNQILIETWKNASNTQ